MVCFNKLQDPVCLLKMAFPRFDGVAFKKLSKK